jgi:hypothetical protein
MHRYREFGLVSDADETLRRAFRDGMKHAGLSHQQFLDALAWYRDHTRPGIEEAALREAFAEFAAQTQWSPQLADGALAVYETIRDDGPEAVAHPPPSPDTDRGTVARGEEAMRRDPASYWHDAALQDAVFEARERLESLSGSAAAPAAPPNPARERVREIEAMLHDSSGAGQRRTGPTRRCATITRRRWRRCTAMSARRRRSPALLQARMWSSPGFQTEVPLPV